ncbi:MAG: DUF192 domain-containing protein [Proteobacteria bacterium]|nr:DUF192 domain-containing protein [Pseudomonadota bacterium]
MAILIAGSAPLFGADDSGARPRADRFAMEHSCRQVLRRPQPKLETVLLSINGRRPVELHLRVAKTAEEQSYGLMCRHPGRREGMLYVFPEDSRGSVWMYQTLVPLETYFLDADGKVVDVASMHPCPHEPAAPNAASIERCRHQRYESSKRRRFMLEFPPELGAALGLKRGDRAAFRRPGERLKELVVVPPDFEK